MSKGFLAGAIWGLVVSVGGAGAVSLALGTPEPRSLVRQPQSETMTALVDPAAEDTTEAAMPEAQLPDTPPVRFEETAETPAPDAPVVPAARRPAAEADVATGAVDTLEAPTGDPGDAVSADVTAPSAMPQPELETAALPTPDAAAPSTGIAVESEAPVMPSVQAALPDAPVAELEPSVASEPAQPPMPQVPTEQSGLVADPETAAAPENDAMADDVAKPANPAPETAEVDSAVPDAVAETPAEAAPPDTTAPEIAVVEEPAPDNDMAPVQSAPDTQSAASDRPAIGTPAASLINRDSAVPEGRLPSVVSAGDEPTTSGAAKASPLIAFGKTVEVADDLPRLSIVLIDDGSGPLGPDTLDAFPFPVTFALDPSQPRALQRMQAYRAQGFEVMALAGVPEGAQPTDVEVNLAATLAALPQVVAVLENPKQGLQGSRQISDQVSQVLRSSGHGLVMLPKGLNTAASLAAREGVPAATVFKDFDGEGQDPRAIRRFLDGAAFRARQDGAVIVMGRLKADTLSALLLWGLQDRASQVALVPVSLVLREAAGI